MTEKPILMSTPMVRAILEGRKSQTRRICKPQPVYDDDSGYVFIGNVMFDIHDKWDIPMYLKDKARWEPGDILWVRETFAKTGDNFHDDWPGHGDYYYKADDPFSELEPGSPTKGIFRWRPSIFMPKEACRIRLEVTDVRVERLNDISEEDTKAEGIEKTPFGYKNYNKSYPVFEYMGGGTEALRSYMSLWESINGEGSWDKNLWVWIIEFKPIKN